MKIPRASLGLALSIMCGAAPGLAHAQTTASRRRRLPLQQARRRHRRPFPSKPRY